VQILPKKGASKSQENENSNIAPVYFAVTLAKSLCFVSTSSPEDSCWFATLFFMGKKEISLSRSWLTLSQHTHTQSWAFGPVRRGSEWSFAQVLAAFEYDEVYMERI